MIENMEEAIVAWGSAGRGGGGGKPPIKLKPGKPGKGGKRKAGGIPRFTNKQGKQFGSRRLSTRPGA